MWKFLLGTWIIMSAFGKSYNQRRKQYNKLVDKHLAQMDENIENYKQLMREGNPFIENEVLGSSPLFMD